MVSPLPVTMMIGTAGSRADLAADGKAIAVGQVEVEGDEIECARRHALQRLRARAGLGDAKAFALEAAAQQKTHLGIVLDDQNVTARTAWP